jgi:predicted enzyme related to lactoylglutathione lyase
MKRSPVVHFEMPAKDKARVSKFYSNAFGWNMVQTGADMGNYVVAQTAETDEKNMVKTAGAVNGGFFDYAEKPGFTEPHIVISVENLDESMESVKKEGGAVDGTPMDIPTIGKYVSIIDTEGNRVGLLQPSM